MIKLKNTSCVFLVLVLVILFLGGCGFAIRYNLNSTDIYLPATMKPLNVHVAAFTDERDEVEKERYARREAGDTDLTDYTYDNQFKGDVAKEITKMLIKHLNYSKVFDSETKMAFFSSEEMSVAVFDSLANEGIDAVMVGNVKHFYGYYDQNVGRQLLYSLPLGIASGLLFSWSSTDGYYQTTYYWYGPGVVLGGYLESLHARKIEQHVQINTELISTTTYETLWEDSFEIFSSEKESIPGISTEQRKFQLTVWSLRDVVNQMVESLEVASF